MLLGLLSRSVHDLPMGHRCRLPESPLMRAPCGCSSSAEVIVLADFRSTTGALVKPCLDVVAHNLGGKDVGRSCGEHDDGTWRSRPDTGSSASPLAVRSPEHRIGIVQLRRGWANWEPRRAVPVSIMLFSGTSRICWTIRNRS